MNPKLLTVKDYVRYFTSQNNKIMYGIDQESASGEIFFCAEIFLPKFFFNINKISSQLLFIQKDYIPDQIQAKFELFGIGSINDTEAFFFKPWIINIDNLYICHILENFQLVIPNILFYNIIGELIFFEKINQLNFKYIRVLQDLPIHTFQRFGLDKTNVPSHFNTGNLNIERIGEIASKEEILKFYLKYWNVITPQLENKYFKPILNTWYRIICEEEQTLWLGLRKSTTKTTIGFLRLYNSNSYFTGGLSLEYIIAKKYRNKGYASRASLALINFLKIYSNASCLSAEVDDDNYFSIKTLKRLGFIKREKQPHSKETFFLSLLDVLEKNEKCVENGEIKFSVKDNYANKYERHL